MRNSCYFIKSFQTLVDSLHHAYRNENVLLALEKHLKHLPNECKTNIETST